MRRAFAVGLAVCLLAVCLLPIVVFATSVTTGTVHLDSGFLNVREGPGTTYAKVGELYDGDVVTILETSADSAWYKITKGSLTGYASADYITVHQTIPDYEPNPDFEAHLAEQNFPEDYKILLRQLHAQYPNWIFMAEHLSMTWAEALTAESKVGHNLITSPEAWKSMEYGAYDWDSKSYVSFDSGGWVTATPSLVAYYLDPRNFLTAEGIFQFEYLVYSGTYTADSVRTILPSALDKYADDVIAAAEVAGVSPYHLATRMAQEGSKIDGTWAGYEGYYNFFNIGAWAHSGNGAVTNGAIYAKEQGWNTPYKCLVGSAATIRKNYIDRGQDTGYYQKFNMVYIDSLYNHEYMTNVGAPASESLIRYRHFQKSPTSEQQGQLVFYIPVYKEMPATAASKPAETGNNNNFLDKLTVTGHSLTPSFDRYTLHYAVDVGEADEVELTAVLNSSAAQMTGTGKIPLIKGDNELTITVTATSGEVRTYTVTVTTTGGTAGGSEPGGGNSGETSNPGTGTPEPPPPPKEPQITGKIYTVTDIVTKVEPETTVKKFLEDLAVTDGSAKLFDKDGKEKAAGNTATGDILRLYKSDGAEHKSYPVVIYGDVNGDGKVSAVDLRIVQKHILDVAKVDGYPLTAADVNTDSKVSAVDLRVMQKFILGITATLP